VSQPSQPPENNAPLVWVLADDRAGNRAQCLGVADRLSDSYLTKEIRFNALVRLPNALRGASRIGITKKSAQLLKKPWPDVVIAAGRRTAPVARWVKRQSPKTKLVQLMWPDAGAHEFDCVVLPSHDREHKDAPQVLRVLGAPHRITPDALKTASDTWQAEFAHLPSPRIAVLAGGSSKHGSFSTTDFTHLGKLIKTFADNVHGSVMLTTSRRTGEMGEHALLKNLEDVPHHLHSWKQSKGSKNPYSGYLALADAIIVTADSIAMCSEACATHKPVYIYQPSTLAPKHQRFINTLIATGYAYPLDETFATELRKPMKKEPLDSAATVANHIRTLL
jgi:mitochondrial fission protein ELM1